MKRSYKHALNQVTSLLFIIALCLVVYTSCQVNIPKSGGGRPDHCAGNAELLYRFCCVIPPFFTRDVAKECGGVFALIYSQLNVTGVRRHSFSCDYWICVLDIYGFLTSKGHVDHEKYFSHLDTWVNLNPAFTDVMLDAKVSCKQTYRFFMPLQPCEFYDLHMCIRNYLKVECPVTIPSKECTEQKEFFKECGKYFYRK